jgi:NADH-quinone oxidoreductase subunit C
MTAAEMVAAVKDRFPVAVRSAHAYRGDATVIVDRRQLLDVARALRDDPAFQMSFLMDLTAVDYSAFGARKPPAFFAHSGVAVKPSPEIPDEDPWPGRPGPERFAVVYHFYSLPLKHRLRLEVPVDEADQVDSLTPLWGAANWLEREAWDMFGVRFKGHPDLRRLLMYQEFKGHPLRKDYPVNKRQPLIGPLN